MEFAVWRSIFWVPPVVSTILLLLSWRAGLLSRPAVVAAFWGVALACQAMAGLFSPIWVAGLVLQACVAIVLGLRHGMSF